MKASAVFVSLGRGAVVDESALALALATQSIKGAVLDVFAVEPLPSESPLWDLDNVLLTAHNADLTANYFELGWDVWAENLDRFVAGDGTLATPVDVAQGY
jgi:phosphoglycerate dehydrogenase-like enzyme